MTTINNSSVDDDEVVTINLILRPIDLEPSVHKREFTLSRQRPSIRIGRASKVPAKGFVAAVDNAWFDSPVMSRQHAELIFDYECTPKGVFIKDIGSLHGTFHTPCNGTGKESRLEQHNLARLASGDLLRFGTDIFRSASTFPPCTVEFYTVRQNPQIPQPIPTISLSTRVFTIPDDIDDDDDDDSVIETALPPTRKSNIQRGLSIDLTRDDTDEADDHTAHNNLNSDVIDLTSEPDEHSDHELTVPSNRHSPAFSSTAGPFIPSIVPPGASSFKVNGYVPDLPTTTYHSPRLAGLDDVPDQFSDHSHNPDPYHEQSDEEMDSDDIRLTDSDNDSVVTRDSLDGLNAMSEETDEDEDDGGSSSSVSYDYGWEAESSSSSQNDSDNGRRALWEGDYESTDDLPYSENGASSSSEDSVDSALNASSPVLGSLENPVSKTDAITVAAPTEASDAKSSFVTPFLFAAPTQQGTPVTHPREPSPSDAAMFKSHPMIDRAPNDSRAQALGEKSGKYEFFAARESNRTTLVDQLPPPPISAIRETLVEDIDHQAGGVAVDQDPLSTFREALIARIGDNQAKSTEKGVDIITAPNVSPPYDTNYPLFGDVQMQEPGWAKPDFSYPAWSLSGERFINNPPTEDLPNQRSERPQSPELDMTSAYTFQLSKMATENRTSQQPRRVGIQDLLVQEANRLEMLRDEQPADPMQVVSMPATSTSPSAAPVPHQELQEHNLKRSFDDAFSDEPILPELNGTISEANVKPSDKSDTEPTSKEQEISTATEDMPSDIPVCQVTPPQSEVQVDPIAVSIRPEYFQPSKRRRFAQAAACVALGGAAAFTFMVSTAPVL
ncbi:uncharacterized protein GGS22DRAFT_135953 [Annulohypoxylon maeteangense]|uniref:uncharacterized protein n=1 Tax=Annulohypoxylon maeteangense TaxID=1927788 RepID=UPI002007F081|nr:uncharacterized protein GGS22DRAFT_135953 [Annulohypoxylon maeteangense]KAI0885916.1 hypothetical protein GGS22DRAFT_135953 [Annulohypoxylon maeteangense]